VGYNPLRKYRGAKAADITILVVTMVVIALLIIWATR
jgi:hypothetical protein